MVSNEMLMDDSLQMKKGNENEKVVYEGRIRGVHPLHAQKFVQNKSQTFN